MNAKRKILLGLFMCGLVGMIAWWQMKQPHIKAGDVLELSMQNLPKDECARWNGNYQVNLAGEIRLPVLGNCRVAGVKPNEAASKIATQLRDAGIYTRPHVELHLAQSSN